MDTKRKDPAVVEVNPEAALLKARGWENVSQDLLCAADAVESFLRDKGWRLEVTPGEADLPNEDVEEIVRSMEEEGFVEDRDDAENLREGARFLYRELRSS